MKEDSNTLTRCAASSDHGKMYILYARNVALLDGHHITSRNDSTYRDHVESRVAVPGLSSCDEINLWTINEPLFP